MEHSVIRYGVRRSRLGWLLLAATPRGVCAVRIGEDRARLVRDLEHEFAFARLVQDSVALGEWLDVLEGCTEGRAPEVPLPLDVSGSAFERRVWRAIARIPPGETRSYGALARALRRPGAARSVGRACGKNPVALLVPCHRVVLGDGGLGGYRYGAARKRQLLAVEEKSERK